MASALLIAVSVLCTTNLQRYLVQGETLTPKFLTTVTNVTVNKGSVAVLPCAVQNIGTIQVVWRRDSSPNPLTIGSQTFTSDSRISVRHRTQPPAWNLHISHVSTEDAGVYRCTLSGRGSVLSRAVSLMVQGTAARGNVASKSGIRISGPQFVEEGHALRLVCNATGAVFPPSNIDWFKDGGKVTQDVRLLIAKTVSMARRTLNSVLNINRAKMSDAGMYVCRTSDLQITSTKVVIIKGSKEEEGESIINTTVVGPWLKHQTPYSQLTTSNNSDAGDDWTWTLSGVANGSETVLHTLCPLISRFMFRVADHGMRVYK